MRYMLHLRGLSPSLNSHGSLRAVRRLAAIFVLPLIAAIGCKSSATVSTGPSPVKCGVSLSMSVATVDSSGGASTFNVTTQPECAWTAASEVNWISGLSPAAGQGNGQIQFRVNPNPAAIVRQGDIVVNDGRVRVQQQPAACQFGLSPASQLATAEGGSMTISVTSAEGCAWTATTTAPWITVSAGQSGNGSGTVAVAVAPNSSGERTGVVTIAGQPWTVTQSGAAIAACTYQLSPLTQSVPPGGGTGTAISVTTTNECDWTAASLDPWIRITSGRGPGGGTIAFVAAANVGSTRTGFILVGDQQVAVMQTGAPSCQTAVSPSSYSADAAGGPGPIINVSSPATCGWTAASGASWVKIASGNVGLGDGVVQFFVDANTGASRTTVIAVAGHTFTIVQAAGTAPPPPPTPPTPTPPTPTPPTPTPTPPTPTPPTPTPPTPTPDPPGPTTCSYALGQSTQSFPASGGAAPAVTVTTGTACTWSASTTASWITLGSAAGTGSGSLMYSVASNPGAARSAVITVAGQALTVSQASLTCTYAIDSNAQSIGAAGGPGMSVAVTAAAGCTWSAASSAPWITITTGATGSGNGSVAFRVDANSGAARSGTVSIADQTLAVSQAGGCTYAIDSTAQSIGAAGGTGAAVAVSTGTGCTWSATSGVPWISLISGASGTGNGSVSFRVDANTSASRSGTVSIADKTLTVTQAGGCTYSIDSTGQSIGGAGGTGTPIGVTTAGGCTWSAASLAPWITITSGASGSGSGSVAFRVDANTGAPRSGAIAIADKSFTVSQAGGCTYSLGATAQSISVSGGAGAPVVVTAAAGCLWTATSNAAWISITSGASGDGNGAVGFSVQVNTSSARVGTLTIAGQTFTVSQASGCSYVANPTAISVAPSGGTAGPVSVTAGTGCTWSATSNASWITIGAGSPGSGTGSVSLNVASNLLLPRIGTVTIEGQTVTINQAGLCTYSIDPTSMVVDRKPGTYSVSVTAPAGCSWSTTPVSIGPWISVTSGSGSGNGTVTFTVEQNNQAILPRVAILLIAGHTFTLTQETK